MKPVATYGPYALIKRIAQSPLATSVAARFRPIEDSERVVALRFLDPTVTGDEPLRDRLVEEVRRAARLNHVNVAQTFDFAHHEDHWYAALEFVDGLPLAMVVEALTEARRSMEPDVSAFVVAELCAALAYAHGRRDEKGKPLDIVHSDVRPRFVLVSRNGEVKLTGFGFSRALLEVRGDELLDRDDRLHYAAPELVRGEAPTPRSDVYGAGMIAWTLLAGRRPFEGMTGAELRRHAENGLVPALREQEPSVPEALEQIIERALSTDPEERPRNATELRTALASWLRSTSPGFGRHRLKAWLGRNVEHRMNDILPAGRWRALHRREFAPADDASVLHTLDEASSFNQRDDVSALLAAAADDDGGVSDLPDWDVSAPHPAVPSTAPRPPSPKGPPRLSPARPIASAAKLKPSAAPKPGAEPAPDAEKAGGGEVFATRSFLDEGGGDSVTAEPPTTDVPAPSAASAPAPAPKKAAPKPPPEPTGPVRESGSAEVAPASPKGDGIDAPAAPLVSLDYEAEVAAASAPAADEPTADDAWDEDEGFDPEAIATAVYDDEVPEAELAAEVKLERKQARARRKAEERAARRFPWVAVLVVVALLGGGGAWVASTMGADPEAEEPVETMGSLFVTSRPAGAEILVDGAPIGRTTPAPVDGLAAGRDVQVSVQLAGHVAPAARTVAVEGGAQGEVRFELSPIPHRVRFTSEPGGAQVIHGGHMVGVTPTTIEAYPVGGRYEATVILRMDGYFDELVNVTWNPGETDSASLVNLRVDENWEPPEEEEGDEG